MKDKKKKEEMMDEEMQSSVIDDTEKATEKKDPLLEEVENLRKEIVSWKEKCYRTVADCDNLRKSYEKDHANLLKYRAMGFVEHLLPVLDSFHLALMVKPEDPALANYMKGFEMIYKQLLTALDQEGVQKIEPPLGSEFDASTMQAIDVKESDSQDKVLQIYSNGYLLKDRLVRPAMVVVSRLAAQTEETSGCKEEEQPLN